MNGKSVLDIDVARVKDIGAPKVDRGIAVGVGRRQVDRGDLATPEMEGHDVVEGHHRQGAGRRRQLFALDEFDELPSRHPAADVVMGDEQRAGLPHVLVAAGMIEVPVGVEDEAHRLVGNRRDGREDLRGERRELVVDHEHGVRPHGKASVAPLPEEDIHPRSQPLGGNPDRIGVLGRRDLGVTGEEYDEGRVQLDVSDLASR